MKVAVVLALVLLTTRTMAADLSPLQLYQAGRYDEAIRAGVAQKTADGFAVAARAELAEERMRATPCLGCLEQAEAYARAAIKADPKAAAGHVYLAAALGYKARIIGTIAAKFKGYAQDAKDNLDVALSQHPNDPWALAALGGWNIAVVNGGGAMLADMLYSASVKQGLAYYAKAFAADPENIVTRFQYALSLSAYDRKAYGKQIEAALQFAANGKPRTAYEKFMQGRAHELLKTIKQNDWKTYDVLVRQYNGYPS